MSAKHFDEAALNWDLPHRVERTAQLFDLLDGRVELRPDMSVMDYGCGTGVMSMMLSEKVQHVAAVDVSGGMLEMLGNKLREYSVENISPVQLDTDPSIPLKDSVGKQDGIVITLALHHVRDVESLVREFHTCLNESGWLCVFDLDEEDGTFHRTAGPEDVHHHGFSRERITQLMENAGFHVESLEMVMSIEKEIDGQSIAFPMFQLVARP